MGRKKRRWQKFFDKQNGYIGTLVAYYDWKEEDENGQKETPYEGARTQIHYITGTESCQATS